MSTSSLVTSFASLLTARSQPEGLVGIEIPIIQRDYAQGRHDDKSSRIRDSFLSVLYSAIAGDEPVPIELDFIYGDVSSQDRILRPLDGQQRLTTLFLLHWHIASTLGVDLRSQKWTAFSYATRPSARLFCERIVTNAPPAGKRNLADWVEDQPWFQYVWRHDPTIQSMLTMMRDIEAQFADADLDRAWLRLTSESRPAIVFHLLSIENMSSPEKLYIKMNSRGKPLTEFENFKARLEAAIVTVDRDRELAHKIDGTWSDTFWPYRGDDDLVDDEMLRYMEFLIELGEWRHGLVKEGSLEVRARRLLGPDNPRAEEALADFISCFDTWGGGDVDEYFRKIFRVGYEGVNDSQAVRLFGNDARINLFEHCLRTFGETRGRVRLFSFGQQLLLAGLLAYRRHVSTEVDPELLVRIRQIRNLIEASENEIRLDKMPDLVAEVEAIAVSGLQGGRTAFNRAQADDELAKAKLLVGSPQLASNVFHLEDHDLLRGSLLAFELDPDTIANRAESFDRAFSNTGLWSAITAALLASGSYARPRDSQNRSFQFGVGATGAPASWRAVLTGGTRDSSSELREALATLLDAIGSMGDLETGLHAFRSDWLARRKGLSQFDWRYYLVEYDAMREGRSGIYFGLNGTMGYSLCMLEKSQLNSFYRDPYLLAIWRVADVAAHVDEPWSYAGYEWSERWLRLGRSGVGVRCVSDGFIVSKPSAEGYDDRFADLATELGIADGLLTVRQKFVDGDAVDSSDRIQVGADLIRRLVERGM